MPLLTTLLRLLFPSWAFFDVASAPPALEVRPRPANGEPGAWRAVVQAPPRRWWHLVFNPLGTRALLQQTLVERWCDEVDGTATNELDDSTAAMTTRLLEHLAEGATVGAWRSGGDAGWEWRVVVREGAAVTVVAESGTRP
jgi:hypothetical protein